MSSPSLRPRFQFSLRWLFVAVAIVAVLFGLLSFRVGQILASVCLVAVFRGVVPTAALVGAIYARGDLRALAIGVLVPSISVVTSGIGPWDQWGLVFGVALHSITIAFCGGIAVVLRRRIARWEPTDVN